MLNERQYSLQPVRWLWHGLRITGAAAQASTPGPAPARPAERSFPLREKMAALPPGAPEAAASSSSSFPPRPTRPRAGSRRGPARERAPAARLPARARRRSAAPCSRPAGCGEGRRPLAPARRPAPLPGSQALQAAPIPAGRRGPGPFSSRREGKMETAGEGIAAPWGLRAPFARGREEGPRGASAVTPAARPGGAGGGAAAGPGLGRGAGRAWRRRRRSGQGAARGSCGWQPGRREPRRRGQPLVRPSCLAPSQSRGRVSCSSRRRFLRRSRLWCSRPASRYRPAGLWDCGWYGCAFPGGVRAVHVLLTCISGLPSARLLPCRPCLLVCSHVCVLCTCK